MIKVALSRESEYNRGAECWKSVPPDLHGGLYVNDVSTSATFS